MTRRRFKYFMPERNEFSVKGEEPLLSVSEYYGVRPRSEVFDDDSAEGRAESLEGYRIVKAGDFVMNYMLAWKGAYGVSDYEGIVSPAYAVYRIDTNIADKRFIHHRLRSEHMHSEFRAHSKGIIESRLRLYPEIFLSMVIDLPDLKNQKVIADFLDCETTRIDQLIEKKQRLVEVVREELAIKLEAATSSLEAKFEEIVPFKWVCRIIEGQVNPTDPLWADKPLIAPNHIQSGTGRLLELESAEEQGAISGKYAFPRGTVLYSKIRPALAKACISPEAGMCSADMYPIIPIRNLRPEFLLMQLLSRKFTNWATLESMRVAMPKINRETLGRFRFWVPDKDLQRTLAQSYIVERVRSEGLQAKVFESIDRLREYRSALITAAVTGQIDIAAWSKRGQTERGLDAMEATQA